MREYRRFTYLFADDYIWIGATDEQQVGMWRWLLDSTIARNGSDLIESGVYWQEGYPRVNTGLNLMLWYSGWGAVYDYSYFAWGFYHVCEQKGSSSLILF